MTRGERDAAYNNTAAVVNSAEVLAGFALRSERIRAQPSAQLDLRYGPRERNRFDYFPAPAPGAVLVFIHGGYWQARCKEHFAFLAAGPLALGLHVALLGYTLAPQAALTQIVEEVAAAVEAVKVAAGPWGGDGNRLILSGWSAGAHLAASLFDRTGAVGLLAVSGIYDLEPIVDCYVNDALRLKPTEARDLSPLFHLPASARPIVVAYGGDELPALCRQSERFAAALSDVGRPPHLIRAAGLNHFTLLQELEQPEGALAQAAADLAGRAGTRPEPGA